MKKYVGRGGGCGWYIALWVVGLQLHWIKCYEWKGKIIRIRTKNCDVQNCKDTQNTINGETKILWIILSNTSYSNNNKILLGNGACRARHKIYTHRLLRLSIIISKNKAQKVYRLTIRVVPVVKITPNYYSYRILRFIEGKLIVKITI